MKKSDLRDLFQIVKLETLIGRMPEDNVTGVIKKFCQDYKDAFAIVYRPSEKSFNFDSDLDLDLAIERPELLCSDYDSNVHQNLYPALFFFQDIQIRNIFNSNTDGSMGLVIFGSLSANNIVVGGQSILVYGDLSVSEVFWGDYNHGLIHVTGRIAAQVFVVTDEYHYDLKMNNLKADYILSDYLEEMSSKEFDPYFVRSIFKTEVCLDLDHNANILGWSSHLDREKIVSSLEKNETLLQNPIQIKTLEQIENEELQSRQRIFTDSTFDSFESLQGQNQNVRSAINVLRKWAHVSKEILIQGFSIYWAPSSETMDENSSSQEPHILVFTHLESTMQFLIGEVEDSEFDSQTKNYPLAAWHRPTSNSEFSDIFELRDSSLLNQMNELWKELLFSIECGQHYLTSLNKMITSEEFHRILEYPVVKDKYKDYDSDEDSGFWAGSRYYSFNTPGLNDRNGLISIAFEIKKDSEEDTEDYCRYYYWFEDSLKPNFIHLKYCSSENDLKEDKYSGKSKTVQLTDWHIFREACRLWPKIEKDVKEENYTYLGDLEYEANIKLEKDKRMESNDEKPYDFVLIEGIEFKLMTIQEADPLLLKLKTSQDEFIFQIFDDPYHFNINLDGSAFFLVADQSVQMEQLLLKRSFENYPKLYVLGYIFLADLTAKKAISPALIPHCPSLIVYGNLATPNLVLTGGLHYAGGSVRSESILTEGLGELHIMGSLTAELVYSLNLGLYVNEFKDVSAICTGNTSSIYLNAKLEAADGSEVLRELRFPATHELSDIVLSDYITGSEFKERLALNPEKLSQLSSGESIIDGEKRDLLSTLYSQESLTSVFNSIFQNPKFKSRFEKPEQHSKDIDSMTYMIKTSSDPDDTTLVSTQELSVLHQIPRIRLRASHDLNTKSIELFLDYLNEDHEVEMMWSDQADSQILELKCVHRAIRHAAFMFLNE